MSYPGWQSWIEGSAVWFMSFSLLCLKPVAESLSKWFIMIKSNILEYIIFSHLYVDTWCLFLNMSGPNQVPLCSYKNPSLFWEDFQQHFRDLCLFGNKRISEVRQWCRARRTGVQSAFQFIPVGLRSGLCEAHINLSNPCLYGPCFGNIAQTQAILLHALWQHLRVRWSGIHKRLAKQCSQLWAKKISVSHHMSDHFWRQRSLKIMAQIH